MASHRITSQHHIITSYVVCSDWVCVHNECMIMWIQKQHKSNKLKVHPPQNITAAAASSARQHHHHQRLDGFYFIFSFVCFANNMASSSSSTSTSPSFSYFTFLCYRWRRDFIINIILYHHKIRRIGRFWMMMNRRLARQCYAASLRSSLISLHAQFIPSITSSGNGEN